MNQSVEFMTHEEQVAATRARRIRLGLDRPATVVRLPTPAPPPPPVALSTDERIQAAISLMIDDIGKPKSAPRCWPGIQFPSFVAAYQVRIEPRQTKEPAREYAERLCDLNGTTLARIRRQDNRPMSAKIRQTIWAAVWKAFRRASLGDMSRIFERDITTIRDSLIRIDAYDSTNATRS